MWRRPPVQQNKRLNNPVLHRLKWKCRSAPELRGPVEREEPLRRDSYNNLPFSFTFRPDGRKYLFVDFEGDEDTVPSLLWGDEAYRHYKMLTMVEMQEKLQQIQNAKTTIIKKYMWKQTVLRNIVNKAKAYYSNPTNENREKWKQLRREIDQSRSHSITDIQYSLAHIPHYLPYFTTILIVAHVLCLIVMCAVGNVAPAGLLSKKEVAQEVQTFLGAETVHRYIIPNPWIGPPATTLLKFGASFGLCLRYDQRLVEETLTRKFRPLDDTNFGCCQMADTVNAAGTTTQEECNAYTKNAGIWSQPRCSLREPGQDGVAHIMQPCCVDHKGTCRMLSLQHCAFLGGTFHPHKEHCVEVLCVRDLCTIGKNLSMVLPDPERPWLPKPSTVWQYWRLLLALVYTYGMVHCLALVALEWVLMRPLEKSAGWFRIMLAYILCGIAGQIVALTAQPYIPHVGSTSGVAGMIGEAVVELGWAWNLLENPRHELIKLGAMFAVLLVLGVLPYVSLLGSLAGCVCGAACAFIFMTYFTFERRVRLQKTVLTAMAVVGLMGFYIVILFTFIRMQPAPCQGCRSLECLSLSEDMCNHWDLLG